MLQCRPDAKLTSVTERSERQASERVPGTFRTVEPWEVLGPLWAMSPLSKPLVGAGVALLDVPMRDRRRARLSPYDEQERVRAAHARPDGAEGRRHFELGLRFEVGRVPAVPGTFRTPWARTRSGNVPNGGKLAFLQA